MTEGNLANQSYTIWIEAECWPPEEWDYEDGNTDVLVKFDDGRQWSATLVTYANVQTLTNKYKQTGESQSGSYFWAAGMVLVESISRASIEKLVRGLFDTHELHTVFTREKDADENTLDWSNDKTVFEHFVENTRREGRIAEHPHDEPAISPEIKHRS